MNNARRITHVIKLDRSTKIILAAGVAVLALQAFGPALTIRDAFAQLKDGAILRIIVQGEGSAYSAPNPIRLKCEGC